MNSRLLLILLVISMLAGCAKMKAFFAPEGNPTAQPTTQQEVQALNDQMRNEDLQQKLQPDDH